MLRSLLRSLLRDLLIAVMLLATSAILPFASFWLCRTSTGAQVLFWCGPFTCAVWVLFIVQLGSCRFWRGAAYVRAWREAHAGYLHTVLRGTCWMFAGLILSFAAELAVVFLVQPTPLVRHIFPVFTYAPVLPALWSAARG